MDHVMIVDDVAVLAAPLRRPTTPQGQELGGAEEALEPVVVDVNIETVTDQARRNAVEDAPQDEAAARGHQDAGLLIVAGSSGGEWLEDCSLDLDAFAVPGVAPPDHLVNEAAVGSEIREVARAAQQELVAKHILEVPMGAFDRAVLVRHAAIVARRRHGVMGAQLLVASCEVLLGSRMATRVISNATPMIRLVSGSKYRPFKYGVMGMIRSCTGGSATCLLATDAWGLEPLPVMQTRLWHNQRAGERRIAARGQGSSRRASQNISPPQGRSLSLIMIMPCRWPRRALEAIVIRSNC